MPEMVSLFLWSFVESIFFPVPPDGLLMALVMREPGQYLVYALVALFGSLLGAGCAYFLGLIGSVTLHRWARADQLIQAERMFRTHGVTAVIVAGITPLPFKVFSIGAGLFGMTLIPFLAASAVSRGVRFFLVSLLVSRYGYPVLNWVEHSFDRWTIVAALGIGVLYLAYRGIASFLTRSK